MTRHPTQLVPCSLPSTSLSEWGHIALTPGHYYPVIMCCSAWLHLLFRVDSLMLEESNFTWWMVIWGGEAVPAQCLASELCTTKCNRCPNWLPPLPTSPVYYKSLSFTSFCQSCEDFSACHNVHEAHSLPRYLLVLLNQTGCQSVHYQCAMKNCWRFFKQHHLDHRFIGLRPFMITEINPRCSSGQHVVCWRQ